MGYCLSFRAEPDEGGCSRDTSEATDEVNLARWIEQGRMGEIPRLAWLAAKDKTPLSFQQDRG